MKRKNGKKCYNNKCLYWGEWYDEKNILFYSHTSEEEKIMFLPLGCKIYKRIYINASIHTVSMNNMISQEQIYFLLMILISSKCVYLKKKASFILDISDLWNCTAIIFTTCRENNQYCNININCVTDMLLLLV
jgi:hypothetical protein